ncbi:ABC transporter permease [Leifsonia shinshuensis]|uniref:Transport permease protein n=1 Tax=Leifsonia shinshuensis TaxID=150026 RepID=A0A853CXW5_9MICO|nr:ABC transporter permease [Leifsonia shinshuensis]NYJ25069.1 ABC-2 type transport system permease protein [Leifsonia shinshuensis]
MTAQDRYRALATERMVTVGGDDKSGGSWASLVDIFRHRELLSLLVRRDLKSRYKDSVLGFVWTLVRPLTQLLIYAIVIGKVLGAAKNIPDFAIYVFTGLTVYALFSEIISGTTASIVGNAGLIKKIYLPREIFPLASVGSAIFNFLIQFVILLGATIVIGKPPLHPETWYLIPSVLLLLVFGTAFGLLLSAVNVYLRDIQYLVEVVLLLLLWASPIVYSWTMVKDALGHGLALDIYTDNPVTLAVLGFQKAMWVGGQGVAEYPDFLLGRMAIAFVIGVVLLLGFQRVFSRLQGNFAQVV